MGLQLILSIFYHQTNTLRCNVCVANTIETLVYVELLKKIYIYTFNFEVCVFVTTIFKW